VLLGFTMVLRLKPSHAFDPLVCSIGCDGISAVVEFMVHVVGGEAQPCV
jgi:hypothetical protein